MKKVVIFDFDGVIVDSFDAALKVAQMQRPALTAQSYKEKFKGNIGKATYAEVLESPHIDFQTEYKKELLRLQIDEKKKKVLRLLSLEFDLHIISSTNSQSIKDFCEMQGVSECFADILGFDIEPSKVNKFRMIFDTYNLLPNDVAFVTDTVGDIEEARKANVGTIIAVTDGFHSREELERAHPTHVIDSMVDLRALLLS